MNPSLLSARVRSDARQYVGDLILKISIGISPVQRARVGVRLGDDALDLHRLADHPGLIREAHAAGAPVVQAVRLLSRRTPDGWDDRISRFCLHLLSPLGVMVPTSNGMLVHPTALVRLAAVLDPGSDAAVLLAAVDDNLEEAAGLLFGETGWMDALAPQELATVAPWTSQLRRARASLAATPDVAEATAMLAGGLRAALASTLDVHISASNGGGDEIPADCALAQAIADVPDPVGPVWANARPLTWLAPDEALLDGWIQPAAGALGPAATVRLLAAALRTLPLLDALASVPWIHEGPPRLAALAGYWSPGVLHAEGLARVLRDAHFAVAPELPAYEALVARPAAWSGTAAWTEVVRLANRPDLARDVEDLLPQQPDWGDFDAPGEGALPRLWAAAMCLAAPQDARWRHWFATFEEGRALAAEDAEALWSGWPSPRASEEQRAGLAGSPMSSYVHGLHDGVAEAYGDVYSQADPFSARRTTGEHDPA